MRVFGPATEVLEGPATIDILDPGGSATAHSAWLFDVLRDLADAGARGAFAPRGTKAPALSLRAFGPAPQGLRAEMDASGVDWRIIGCVASAIAARGLDGSVSDLRLTSRGAEPHLVYVSLDGIDASIFPGLRPDLGFVYMADTTITSRMRSTIITLTDRATKAEADSLARWIAPWARLVEAGAFAATRPFPIEARNFCSGVQSFERDSLEIVLDRFDGDGAAFDILANMLAMAQAAGLAILKVEQY